MKIEFFESDSGLDPRAIKGGVYQVQLKMEDKAPICLYIGESVWIAKRCGEHIYSLYEDPAYFGLTRDDLNNDQFTISFSVIEEIEGKKSELGEGSYKEQELKSIKELNPLTQLETSDRQIRKVEDKVDKIQKALISNGFKIK